MSSSSELKLWHSQYKASLHEKFISGQHTTTHFAIKLLPGNIVNSDRQIAQQNRYRCWQMFTALLNIRPSVDVIRPWYTPWFAIAFTRTDLLCKHLLTNMIERLHIASYKGIVLQIIWRIAVRQPYDKSQTRFNPQRHDLHTFSMALLFRSHNSHPYRFKPVSYTHLTLPTNREV